MTRFPYDQFSKDYLKELLLPLGEVVSSRKVATFVREIDVYFAPSLQAIGDTMELGLLGRFAATPALFEHYIGKDQIQRLEPTNGIVRQHTGRWHRHQKMTFIRNPILYICSYVQSQFL